MGNGIGVPLRNGYYQAHRSVITDEILGNQARLAVWTYLTSQAGYTTGHWRDRNEIILLKNGDLVCSIRIAAKACGMARETFKKTLTYLAQKGLITFRALKTGTLVRMTKKISDAVIRPRGQSQATKERKVFSKSYNSLPNYVAVSPAGLVLGVKETKGYLEDFAKPCGTVVPDIARELLSRWKGLV